MPRARLLGREDLGRIPWPPAREGEHLEAWYESWLRDGTEAWVSLRMHLGLAVVGHLAVPFTVPGKDTSPHPVALPSVGWLGPVDRPADDPERLALAERWPRAVFDRCVLVGGPPAHEALRGAEPGDLTAIHAALVERYPDRAVVFRGLRPGGGPALGALRELGYALLRGRREWWADHTDAGRRTTDAEREDLAILEQLGGRVVDGRRLEARDQVRCATLHRGAAVSRGDPWALPFAPRHLARVQEQGVWRVLAVLVHDQVAAVIGFVARDQELRVPLLGWDAVAVEASAFQRAAHGLLAREATERACLVIHADGDDALHAQRGHEAVRSFDAVFVDHLPSKRRRGWRDLSRALAVSP